MSKLPKTKRVAAKARRKLNPHASQSRGGAMRKKPAVEDQKQSSDDIRRAVDDGMQDLRTKKSG